MLDLKGSFADILTDVGLSIADYFGSIKGKLSKSDWKLDGGFSDTIEQ